MPAWNIKIDGTSYTVPEATLKVVPPGEEFNNVVFIKVLPEKKDIYVGESIPTAVKIFTRGDIGSRINGIQKIGDAFSQSKMPDESLQSIETIDGQQSK